MITKNIVRQGHQEENKFVVDGSHERVFVCELEPGDVNVFGEMVTQVLVYEHTRSGVQVQFAHGETIYYRKASSTVLIRTHK